MSKKTERAAHGPSWTEVILGALLSFALGIVLGAAILILRPPQKEPAKPAERKSSVVYYAEGSRETGKAKQALAKRKAFVGGQSVTVNEDEINSFLPPVPAAPPAAAPKAGDKKVDPKAKTADAKNPAAAAPDTGETMAVGAANVRIRDGVVQVAAPVTLNALGLSEKVIVQARGGFTKQGDVFAYEPSELYIGSCPVQRLPFVCKYVRDKVLTAQPIPEDLATAWRKLTNVAVEGNTVRLSMP